MTCPHCGTTFVWHEPVAGNIRQQPIEGSASMCMGCGCFSIFVQGTGGLYLRKPTTEELYDLVNDPRVQEIYGGGMGL